MNITREDIRSAKAYEVGKGIEHIMSMLKIVNPQKAKRWRIEYMRMGKDTLDTFGSFEVNYHGLLLNEEYIMIFDETGLLYAINVTGNSVLYTLKELMDKCADKF